MLRRAHTIFFGSCFLLSASGAALDVHLHESPTDHSSGHCGICAHLVSQASALVGETVSWSTGLDYRREHAPAAIELTPAAGSHHESAAPRAPPIAAL